VWLNNCDENELIKRRRSRLRVFRVDAAAEYNDNVSLSQWVDSRLLQKHPANGGVCWFNKPFRVVDTHQQD